VTSLRVPPGTFPRVGVVGAGQLGTMLAREAHRLGFEVHVLDADPHAPAFRVARSHVVGSWTDPAALRELAGRVDVLTVERDDVSAQVLGELQDEGRPVSPDPRGLALIQDKLRQRERMAERGLPGPRFAGCGTDGSRAALAEAARAFGFPLVQKLRSGGYDGRGVAVIEGEAELDKLLEGPSLFEAKVDLKRELAVMVSLGADEQVAVYPVCELVVDPATQQLDALIAPGRLGEPEAERAQELAVAAAQAFGGQGMFGVELFEDAQGELPVNEVSPRPHNTGHYTIEGCVTSQFEQHLRAICGLPLGSTELLRPAAMANLVGAGTKKGPPKVLGLADALAIPGVAVHLYGKAECRPNRKMGHLTALGATTEEALDRARLAQSKIRVVADTEEA
jgi:5-(carboxyamino)imidazole ribonucleotide synthase